MHDALKAYPVVVTINVAWGDMDAFKHVNNAMFFRYFETSRIEYFDRIGMLDQMKSVGIGPILADVSCRFRQPVEFPDQLLVGTRISDLRVRGFMMDHLIVSTASGAVAAEGQGRIACFNYQTNDKAALPDAVVQAILKMQPELG